MPKLTVVWYDSNYSLSRWLNHHSYLRQSDAHIFAKTVFMLNKNLRVLVYNDASVYFNYFSVCK